MLPSACGPRVFRSPMRSRTHSSHRNEAVIPSWDWSFDQDGSLALDRSHDWPEPPHPAADRGLTSSCAGRTVERGHGTRYGPADARASFQAGAS